MVIGLASAAPGCETNTCLPSTTCVSGPQYTETFSAAVPVSDAASGDATAETSPESGAPDASLESGSPDAAEPSEGAAEAESPDDASDE
ncbi:MAG TPA: hypothetical protein VK841_21890 [Polyangiaceae bacterium]|nr:hypothetical protein [Polyangiaceae bacterium]